MSKEKIVKDLFKEFEPHSYEMWHEAAIKLLKGASFEKKLITKTDEGITLKPLYRREDIKNLEYLKTMPGFDNFLRGSELLGYLNKDWLVSQPIFSGTPEKFNLKVKHEIERGVTELYIKIDDAIERKLGNEELTSIFNSIEDFEIAFNGINLSDISLFFSSSISSISTLLLFSSYCRKHCIDIEKLKISITNDPVNYLVKNGKLPTDLNNIYVNMKNCLQFLNKNNNSHAITINSEIYHNSGSTAVQEVGFSLATGVEYVRNLIKNDFSIDEIFPKIRFIFAVGGNLFMEIAKFRAARILWSKIGESYGKSYPMFIHTISSRWNKTIFDPYVNVLRNTTETFSSIIGGANSITVTPFDEIIRVPDEFSSRIARNIQIILRDECNLKDVIDPSGGSYYIEWLTDQIASESWKIFQEIEKNGGMVESLKRAIPQTMVEESKINKKKNISKRKSILVGTNMFPNGEEKLLEKREKINNNLNLEILDKNSLEKLKEIYLTSKMAIEDLSEFFIHDITTDNLYELFFPESNKKIEIEKIVEGRAAEDFEKLRLASIDFKEKNGHFPTIFQANFGASRFYRARADWTTSFFQVGGFHVEADKDFETIDEILEEFKNSKSKIVVIVSSDDKYPEIVEKLSERLKKIDNSLYILVAGNGGEFEKKWRECGVDDFVNVRVNNYTLNEKLLSRVGAI